MPNEARLFQEQGGGAAFRFSEPLRLLKGSTYTDSKRGVGRGLRCPVLNMMDGTNGWRRLRAVSRTPRLRT